MALTSSNFQSMPGTGDAADPVEIKISLSRLGRTD
jgi:hypothetical protein